MAKVFKKWEQWEEICGKTGSSLTHLDHRNVKDKATKDPEDKKSWNVSKKDNDLVKLCFKKLTHWAA